MDGSQDPNNYQLLGSNMSLVPSGWSPPSGTLPSQWLVPGHCDEEALPGHCSCDPGRGAQEALAGRVAGSAPWETRAAMARVSRGEVNIDVENHRF